MGHTRDDGKAGPAWTHVDYEPGADAFWDRIGGDDWGAIDGVVPGVRVYATWGEQRDGRLVVTGLCLRGSPDHPLTADTMRAVPIGRLEAGANEAREQVARSFLGKVAPLRRPDGSDPDTFYKLVGDHYRWHAAVTAKPAARIAADAGVPVTTVHRWIREARRRGHLPPGRKGKAG